MAHRSSIIAGILAAVSLLVACSGGGNKQPATPSGQPGAARPSAFDQVLEQIRRDGDVTLPTALQAFSLAFGDLPGVSLPDGAREPVVYGGGPLRWIERYWDELSSDQKSAAIQRLGFDPTARLAPKTTSAGDAVEFISASARTTAGCQAEDWSDSPGAESYRATLKAALSKLGGFAGDLPGETAVRMCPSTLPGDEGAWASAHPQWGANGYVGCVMYVYPPLLNGTPLEILAIITHEAWHCFQGSTAVGSLAHRTRPAWVVEGQAMWVGEAYGGGPTTNERAVAYWKLWMGTPQMSLFVRDYDAAGFWATLASVTGDGGIFGVMFRTLGASGSDEAYFNTAVGGLGTAPFEIWASRYFRLPAPPAWDATGAGVQPASVAPAPKIETVQVGQEIVAPAHAAALAYLEPAPDITIITVDGPTRVGDKGTVDAVVAGSFTACNRDDRCKCPEGTTAPGSSTDVRPPLRIAVTGVSQETAAHTQGLTLDEWCRKKPTPASGQSPTSTAPVSVCAIFPLEDAQLLAPGVSLQGAVEPTPGSGSCLYGSQTSSQSAGVFILRRPSAALAASDYPTVTNCSQELPGIGDRAGTGTSPEGSLGCLLKGNVIVRLATNGNAAAIPEVLRRIAARLP